jgi:predicted rRNA methylase YqxC with S4 and FtsJ domains
MLGLVKPMFELRLPTIPSARAVLDEALRVAVAGVDAAGWGVVGADECPVRGMRGAVEFFIHARRR